MTPHRGPPTAGRRDPAGGTSQGPGQPSPRERAAVLALVAATKGEWYKTATLIEDAGSAPRRNTVSSSPRGRRCSAPTGPNRLVTDGLSRAGVDPVVATVDLVALVW